MYNGGMMNENYNTPNSGCCGRPFPTAPENKCKYNDCCMNEYAYKQRACIRNKQPDCESQAVIPSITVETVDGISNLANCLVHVMENNTTYYVDDKHRVMITWAGPVNIPGYDMERNPEKFKDQIVTDVEAETAVIYDNHGKGYIFGITPENLQQAVNDKLDEMAADGTLESIISQYIEDVVFGFDTVADMKAATNLIDGSYARTLGYYNINDGGSATYKISSALPSPYHEVLNNGLYATLVVNSSTNILHFGAKSDGSGDISNPYNAMLSQLGHIVIPKGTYRLDNPITITTSYDIKCSGTIDYKGNNYAFILQKANNCNYEIERINSAAGGAFDVSSTDAVSFINIKLNRAYVSREVFNLNANNGIVTLLNLEGVRWSSEDSSPIVMFQDSTALSSAFLSEINIFNVDLLSKNQRPAIRATCDHPTKSINFNLDNVDLENSWGIHTYKRIFSIGMYNCRLGEINYKQGWLTFNDYCPKMTIVGTGDIDPSYITYNNVGTAYQYEQGILVLANVVDHISQATYNGAIITKNQLIPFARRWVWKSITNDIDTDTDTVTLPTPQPSGNLYNNFSFAYSNDLTINVPDNFADEFILSTSSAINITVRRGTYSTSFTNVPGNVYKVMFFGTGLKVETLS